MSTEAGPPVTVVVGAGLVGASIGHALTAAGWQLEIGMAKPG